MSSENQEKTNIDENINSISNNINYSNQDIENSQKHNNENINNINIEKNQSEIPSKNSNLNPEYFDEFGRPRYEEVVQFENQLRNEIELNSPLVSDKLDIHYLLEEFKDSQFEKSVLEITQKYKNIRTVRRDGNCFYRSFMFRLFEQLSQKKENSLYSSVVKVVEESKNLCEKNGYQWMVFEDFYNMFISEWKFVYQLDPLNTAEYMYEK
jgi:hypothetical protein